MDFCEKKEGIFFGAVFRRLGVKIRISPYEVFSSLDQAVYARMSNYLVLALFENGKKSCGHPNMNGIIGNLLLYPLLPVLTDVQYRVIFFFSKLTII